MALNIKDPATEALARELAALTGEKLTQSVRIALEERLRTECRKRDCNVRLQRVQALIDTLNAEHRKQLSSDHSRLYDEQGLPC
jgi:antitoxin VapB